MLCSFLNSRCLNLTLLEKSTMFHAGWFLPPSFLEEYFRSYCMFSGMVQEILHLKASVLPKMLEICKILLNGFVSCMLIGE